MLMFGFSRSYWEAIGWRFLNGALQSNRPITNAVIAEVCAAPPTPRVRPGCSAPPGRVVPGSQTDGAAALLRRRPGPRQICDETNMARAYGLGAMSCAPAI